ncbi:MAG TPA: efflux RND transporter permease subunit [Xanthobacteraceae bacterium]|nr:efflux RND transporter permease subunit [Xanthobacteraceae bacterium]
MNVSYPFIMRPVGTTLLAVGLMLVGIVAYRFLPVASMPNVELPTIRVSASRPGADPAIVAATVAAPLERALGTIAGVTEITSVSSLGSTTITVQFDLSRSIDGAARDVQAAINAALNDLPSDLPSLPSFRKANPAAVPVLILALTSKTIAASALYDAADTVIAQRIAQVSGVADVTVNGAEQPAVRVRVDPGRLASAGIALEDVRAAIANANAQSPIGVLDGSDVALTIGINDQLRRVPDYKPLVVKTNNGNIVRLSDIASVEESTRNTRSGAWFNRQPSVLLVITKQGDANVIETVDAIRDLIPEIKRFIPADIDIAILSDRTKTIRASVEDMQLTLLGTIAMVMLVVFVFLRRMTPTVAAGITVPLSLAGTCALMWCAGFSIDNLSLMALAVSVGFVVDDAIVMIENVFRNMEKGHSPLRATLQGARQIGFTVISISISLVAAFIPLLFMGGIVGRAFREFSVTLAFAILVSTIVSVTVTPMICAHYVRSIPSESETRFDRMVGWVLSGMTRAYGASLEVLLGHRVLMMFVMAATLVLTADLYIKVPKGWFPQDDTGLLVVSTRAAPDISYKAMVEMQSEALAIVLADPAVDNVGSSVGGSSWNASVNQGRMFVSLKPIEQRDYMPTNRVIDRMRPQFARIPGIEVYMFPAQDVRVGGRQARSQYQFTLWSSDLDELLKWVPKAVERVKGVPGVVDVSTDREQGGFQLNVSINRQAAAQLGVRIQDLDAALANAYSQRQISTIYTSRNQYTVILEVDAPYQRDPNDIARLYVAGRNDTQIPIANVARFERSIAPLVINHQGQFPSVTISFALREGESIDEASAVIQQAILDMRMPDIVQAEFAGDAKAFASSANAQPLLVLAALVAVYLVLGILYESLAHPLTIISTLPSAGLGALLALQLFHAELTIIAFIGIILLIGIVKKNGIMLVDFALDAERERGLAPERAIYEACLERFRPILMTTLAALLGAVPLVVASGPGSELRRPLGITIIGGLLVSQVLTLYTTPVIYLMLDKLHRRLGGHGRLARQPRAQPAE